MHAKFGPASKGYFAAKKLVSALHQYGNLGESKIYDFAQSRKLDEATIGLSLLCSLPADVVERALADKDREMLLVLTKALDFSWPTTMSLLFLSAPELPNICAGSRSCEQGVSRAQYRNLPIGSGFLPLTQGSLVEKFRAYPSASTSHALRSPPTPVSGTASSAA
jgi:hypothetical protein